MDYTYLRDHGDTPEKDEEFDDVEREVNQKGMPTLVFWEDEYEVIIAH